MASKRISAGEDDRLAKRSKNASKLFSETGLGKLPPEIREMIFISLLATPSPYAGHEFATNCAGPKSSPSAPKKFVHIKASWYQVTQTCRQIYLESYPLFFASESYYLATPQESSHLLDYGCVLHHSIWGCVLDDLGCRHVLSLHLRRSNITTLCLEGFVTDKSLYNKETIDKILSDPTDYRNAGRTRQQLEAQTFKDLDRIACRRLSALPNLKTVGLRMRVGQEMEYVNFMYGVSEMRRGLVEFVDQSHWLIRNQHPNDLWRIQYACFSMADYGRDENMERISYDRRRIEEEVTDIDSRAPGLQEGDERYVEVLIQRVKRDDEIGTVSEVSDAGTEDLSDTPATLRPEPSDLDTTQVGGLQDIPETAHDDDEIELEVAPMDMEDDLQIPPLEHQGILLPEVEIELGIPPMEMEDDLEYHDIQLPAHDGVEIELKVPPIQMEDDLQTSPLDNDLGGMELEHVVLNTSEPFVQSQSQDDSQSNEHSDQENDHALSDTASHDVSSIHSTEPSRQQAEESLLPTYSAFVWHPVPTNTDSSRKFQTDSDDEDSHSQSESRFGDQVLQTTKDIKAQEERRRTDRRRLLRQQFQQPLSHSSDIPKPHTEKEVESFRMLQELADLSINEQTETSVQELIQPSTTSSEMREHGIKSRGAISQKATSIEKQPLTAFLKWFWLLCAFFQIWSVLLIFCYLWLLVIFLTASSQNMHGN